MSNPRKFALLGLVVIPFLAGGFVMQQKDAQDGARLLDQVLQMTIYISDIELWGGVNTVYARVMGSHRPARAVVPVKDLHYGYQIEIQAIAATRA